MGNPNWTLVYLVLAIAVIALFGINIVLLLEALRGNILACSIVLGSGAMLAAFLVRGGYLKKDTPKKY